MIGEALTTKLARERLAAIKKFIPVRVSVRQKLQRRQEAQTDFTTDTQQLFQPITTASKDIKTATERVIYGDIPEEGKRREVSVIGVLDKIAAETEKTQRGIQQLSGDIKTQHDYERLADIDDSAPEIGTISKEKPKQSVPFTDKFTEDAIKAIRMAKLEKPDDYAVFGDFAIQNYYSKGNFLKDE